MRKPTIARGLQCRIVALALAGWVTLTGGTAATASGSPPARFALQATLVAQPDTPAAAGLALKARLAPVAHGALVGANFSLSASVGAPAGACAIDSIFANGFEGVP